MDDTHYHIGGIVQPFVRVELMGGPKDGDVLVVPLPSGALVLPCATLDYEGYVSGSRGEVQYNIVGEPAVFLFERQRRGVIDGEEWKWAGFIDEGSLPISRAVFAGFVGQEATPVTADPRAATL